MTIKNQKKNGVKNGVVKLLPGHNEVNTEVWNAIKSNCNIDNVGLEEVVIATAGKGDNVVEFVKMRADKKLEIIVDTFDIHTLKKWYDDEKEGNIRNAIDKQMKKLEN